MSGMPKVSIIFPIYNNEIYIERAIRSVMNQTLKEIEIILIDDGSSDHAPDICDSLAKEDKRILVIHKKNEGSAAGRNQGIEISTGEYLAFVESDDYAAENMYELLYKRAGETNADIVKCSYYVCDKSGNQSNTFLQSVGNDMEVFTGKERPRIFMHHASMWAGLYRREFIVHNNIKCIVTPSATYSDFSWMAMTYAKARGITVVNRPLYYYNFDNPDSSWRNAGEKVFYKPFHCLQANRILREENIFEYVKEEIGYQEYRTCMGHAQQVRKELRQEYFNRMKSVMEDITKDGFRYKYFKKFDKRNVELILENKMNAFYRAVELRRIKRTIFK